MPEKTPENSAALRAARPDHHTAADREGEETGLSDATGVYDRAIGQDGRWGTYDIAELDRDSLVDFVRSRGEVSTWALHLILIMLGHDREGVE